MTLLSVRLARLVALPALLALLAVGGVAAGSWPQMPAAASPGLENATTVSGQVVPARDAVVADEGDEGDEGEEETVDEGDEGSEGLDEDETDGDTDGEGDLPDAEVAGDTHGALVSAAAHDCPKGAGHGACVRDVARDNAGHADDEDEEAVVEEDEDAASSRLKVTGQERAATKRPQHAATLKPAGPGHAGQPKADRGARANAGGTGHGGANGNGANGNGGGRPSR